MSIEVVSDFKDIATVRVIAYVYDDDDTLTDASAVILNIYDPSGTLQVDGDAMTHSDTGIYEYYFHKGSSEDPMDKGNWRGEVIVQDGSGADAIFSPGSFSFKVK